MYVNVIRICESAFYPLGYLTSWHAEILLTSLFEMEVEINEHPFPKRDVICMLIANMIFRVCHQGGTCGYIAIIRRHIIVILYVTFSYFLIFNSY